MAQEIDKEIDAIKSALEALTPLPPDGRAIVLKYVIERLQIEIEKEPRARGALAALTGSPTPDVIRSTTANNETTIHIRDLKDLKKPRSANEMAAVVAYYL